MKLKLKKTIWFIDDSGNFAKHNGWNLPVALLLDMGATPCGKCGERECEHEYHTTKHGYTFCTHCGKSEPKEEKIEMPQKPSCVIGDASALLYVGECICYLANKLNGDN